MAAKLSTSFLGHGCIRLNSKHSIIRLPDFSLHLLSLPASSTIRQRNLSFRHQREEGKKLSAERSRMVANLQPNDGADVEFESAYINDVWTSKQKMIPNNNVDNVFDSKPGTLPESEDTTSSSISSQPRGLKWWIQVAFYIVCILLGQSVAVLLGRLYYNKGGNSKWVATLVQLVGFPLLFPLYRILPKENAQNYTQVSPLKVASIYIFFGLFVAADSMLYSIGLQYMPVSTFSLICASQLAFNAVFSVFINSQKFTPYIINSLVLLTISSTLLVFHSDSSLPIGVSKAKYAFGFTCAIAYTAGYGLFLSLTQFAFERVLKNESFKAILDLIVYQSFIASCATAVGLFVSGDWKTLKVEMSQFQLGKFPYIMTLVSIAFFWQVYFIGLVGLIVKVSSLFSNVVATVGLPIVPVLAVVFFHDTMDAIKVVAMVLAIWGFVSYAYDQYLDQYNTKTVKPANTYASEACENKN